MKDLRMRLLLPCTGAAVRYLEKQTKKKDAIWISMSQTPVTKWN
jgi:hypothetical protein